MLDKSIPLKKVIMRLEAKNNTCNVPSLPVGFKYRFFENGDEYHWARIETSVLEFHHEDAAVEYFSKEFLPYPSEIKRRCVFIVSPDGLPIATTTAWFRNVGNERYGQLHWVAVCPEYQGMGLGKAVVQKVLTVFQELEPGRDIWLGTQTWSHVAIRMYYKLGFRLVREETVDLSSNVLPRRVKTKYDIDAALEILKNVYEDDFYQELVSTIL
ncbi:MAG TPA: GNAT family N-acetyltransferase [Clostridiaceae bacterium]|nr:GNAT family N-acetyltransferase [Clostridiaceae bacterium]